MLQNKKIESVQGLATNGFFATTVPLGAIFGVMFANNLMGPDASYLIFSLAFFSLLLSMFVAYLFVITRSVEFEPKSSSLFLYIAAATIPLIGLALAFDWQLVLAIYVPWIIAIAIWCELMRRKALKILSENEND